MQEEEKSVPVGIHHYLGWIILGVVLVPLILFSLSLHMKENREIAIDAEQWKANWPQLKIGMQKEEVLSLVGAPNSTTVIEAKDTKVVSDPPDDKTAQAVQQALEQEENYAIWSYYEPIIIHTHPGDNPKKAENESVIKFKELVNDTGTPKLHGHAIKFNGAGEIIEISQ